MKVITSILMVFSLLMHVNAQTLNTEISIDGQTPFLLGEIDKSGLEGENYKSWFTPNYEAYTPKNSITTAIAKELQSYSILLFLGTWCGDSKNQVPKLYKVLEACNFPMKQLKVIAVSRQPNMYKQSPQHEESGLNIHRVPTLIFYKNGIEVNRIVEHPVKSFEEDIKNIITVNDYKSNYQIVTAINALLKTKGVKQLKKERKTLIKKYDGIVTSMFELNTYGRVLYGTGNIEASIEVFMLNTKLFPDEPRTYMSLANTVAISGNPIEGIKILNKATEMFPENENIKENLDNLKAIH